MNKYSKEYEKRGRLSPSEKAPSRQQPACDQEDRTNCEKHHWRRDGAPPLENARPPARHKKWMCDGRADVSEPRESKEAVDCKEAVDWISVLRGQASPRTKSREKACDGTRNRQCNQKRPKPIQVGIEVSQRKQSDNAVSDWRPGTQNRSGEMKCR